MDSAEVTIHLRKGSGNTLKADCFAEFILIDKSKDSMGDQEFLVAFPVTGMKSEIVTVDNFEVKFDDAIPPTVFRQPIFISRNKVELQDTPISGKLKKKFRQKKGKDIDGWNNWGITLSNESFYPAAYIWSQKSTPGKQTSVIVKYTFTLHPQSVHYSKSYERSAGGSDVIPFDDIQVSDWDDQYYFFDYILRSGATWDGPIGNETVTLTVDPNLGIDSHDIDSELRHPVDYRNEIEKIRYSKTTARTWNDPNKHIWTISGEPDSDILFSIPLSSIKDPKQVPQE